MTKREAHLNQLGSAVKRLGEVLEKPKDEFMRDSAILRFEIAMDLAWKALKTALQEKYDILVQSPRKAFREAYKQGLVEHDEAWIDFIKMRNEAAHIYKEEMAENVYAKLPEVLVSLQALLARLEEIGKSAD